MGKDYNSTLTRKVRGEAAKLEAARDWLEEVMIHEDDDDIRVLY